MQEPEKSSKEAFLSEINARMHEECRCPLKKTATNPVPGEGSACADIVFIGEAPGKTEDEKGRPFVGAAGKFLNEMLDSIGLSRDDIYITNIVKYRPPGNRDPLPREIDDCAAWLREQILLIDPKIIVPLGRHAMSRFFPSMKISESHGQSFRKTFPDIGTRVVIPLYHPAAALYNGGMRETLKADFLRIPKLIEKARDEE